MQDTLDLPTIDATALDGDPFVNINRLTAKPTTAIARIDLKALALTRFGEWRPLAAALAAKYAHVAFAVSTTKGYDEAKKALAEVRAPRYAAQNVAKASKTELAQVSKAVGAEEQAVADALADTEQHIKAQLDAEDQRRAAEKAERERIDAERRARHEGGIATIRSYVHQAAGKTAAQIAVGIAAVDGIEIGPEWEEFTAAATLALVETHRALTAMREAALASEAEVAERLREREENARVAADLAAERLRLTEEAAAVRLEAEALCRAREEAESAARIAQVPPLLSEPASMVTVVGSNIVKTPITIEFDQAPLAPAPTLKLGAIAARLGFTLTQAFIEGALKLPSSGREKSAVLWHETEWPNIKAALVRHIEAAA